ncbi:MAG: hypothetical protein IPJ74_14555 [Saprospiraceae bacterium]|nr:hypothetical protein [Saprospiraceae bacterium]
MPGRHGWWRGGAEENVGNNTSGTYIQAYFLTDNSPDKIVLDFRVLIEQEQGAGNMEDRIAELGPGEYCIYSLNFQSAGCQPMLNSEPLADFLARCLDGVCYDLSDPLCLTVNAIPAGTISSNFSAICAGESIELTFTATVGVGPFDIVVNGTAYNDVVNGSVFATLSPNSNTDYTLTQITDNDGCIVANLSQAISITVTNCQVTVDPCTCKTTLRLCQRSVQRDDSSDECPRVRLGR